MTRFTRIAKRSLKKAKMMTRLRKSKQKKQELIKGSDSHSTPIMKSVYKHSMKAFQRLNIILVIVGDKKSWSDSWKIIRPSSIQRQFRRKTSSKDCSNRALPCLWLTFRLWCTAVQPQLSVVTVSETSWNWSKTTRMMMLYIKKKDKTFSPLKANSLKTWKPNCCKRWKVAMMA